MKSAFSSLADALGDLAEVVRQLTPDEYLTPGPAGVSGSVGGHVRHCLDHVFALEGALDSQAVDYDRRDRATPIERDHAIGLRALDETRCRLAALEDSVLSKMVTVRAQLDRTGRDVVVRSTIGRELAFVISHTIHHSATINVLLLRKGKLLPARFGIAPSTPLAEVSAPCALSA